MRFALRSLAIAVAVSCLVPAWAFADSFLASLSGAQEVPASGSQAFGTGVFTYVVDAQMVSYTVTFIGIASPTAIHIHGPAGVGHNADILFTLPTANPTFGVVGPITAQQADDMRAGLWYVNVHSAALPTGDIRGQILNITAVQPSTWSQVRELYAR
jgi:hypothetical protein